MTAIIHKSEDAICKLAVIQYGLEQSGLAHNLKWELAAITADSEIIYNP